MTPISIRPAFTRRVPPSGMSPVLQTRTSAMEPPPDADWDCWAENRRVGVGPASAELVWTYTVFEDVPRAAGSRCCGGSSLRQITRSTACSGPTNAQIMQFLRVWRLILPAGAGEKLSRHAPNALYREPDRRAV